MDVNYPESCIQIHGRPLPETGTPVGYAALIEAWDLSVPIPSRLSLVREGRREPISTNDWQIFSDRYLPPSTLAGHLTFAQKYEGLDLGVLKKLFEATGPKPIEAWVTEEPTGSYARRVWFLYEWLLAEELDLQPARGGRYVHVVDPDLQYSAEPYPVTRQRLYDNIPGTRKFAPLVYRTGAIEHYRDLDLTECARRLVAGFTRELLNRTAAFLLLSDSRSSHIIEGETPPVTRLQRWAREIAVAGEHPLTREQLLRLQSVVLEETRFIDPGFRTDGGFVGSHDRLTGQPIPDHISARPEDLPTLLEGLIEFDAGRGKELDPVVAAAVLAFGFIYIHPFSDGNGRIHRYLIHHVLAERGFNPAGFALPISTAILESIDRYRKVLESYSRRLLPIIEWRPTESFNVEVINDTGDFYRYFDATPHVEFLYACLEKTIRNDLPDEAEYLRRYDEFRRRVETIVEMPASTFDLLFRFLQQNGGSLSKRARAKEFEGLTEFEVMRVEKVWQEVFES